jgi:hypothetical protein
VIAAVNKQLDLGILPLFYLRPSLLEGQEDCVELYNENEELVSTVGHWWMADKALRIANYLGSLTDDMSSLTIAAWVDSFNRRMNRLLREVSCPTCEADVGEVCKRPSEHPLYGDKSHGPRRDTMDEWLLRKERK